MPTATYTVPVTGIDPVHPGFGGTHRPEGLTGPALIRHDHYDHGDLDTFAAYRDRSVPLLAPATVAGLALAHGFEDVTVLRPWQQAGIGGVTRIDPGPQHQRPRQPHAA